MIAKGSVRSWFMVLRVWASLRLLAGLAVEWPRRHSGAAIAQHRGRHIRRGLRHRGEPGGRQWLGPSSGADTAPSICSCLKTSRCWNAAPLALLELSPHARRLERLWDRPWSSRHAPRLASGTRSAWPARLVNRLLGGLTARIDPPSLASRRRYLHDRARARGLVLTAEAVEISGRDR